MYPLTPELGKTGLARHFVNRGSCQCLFPSGLGGSMRCMQMRWYRRRGRSEGLRPAVFLGQVHSNSECLDFQVT